jgi:GntR family transcriptional regulator, transcriptional repressor for pyruvate dehydrogenase complex
MLEPPKKTRLYENIIEQLLSLIKDGTLKPGDKLPTERKLAEDLSVSRTAIREALRSLEVLGYIHSKVGGGTYISQITLENVMSPFSAVLSQNSRLIIELLEVRMLLEAEITRLATKRITPSKMKKIQKALDDMRAEIDAGTNALEADNSFHNALAAASENQAMKLILDMCGSLLSQSREATLNIPGQPEITLDEHEEIYEAIRKGDSDLAAFRMQQHLRNAKKNLEKYKEDGEPSNLTD